MGPQAQRLQYPLINEYSLNQKREPSYIYFKEYSLAKGYWSLRSLGRAEAGWFRHGPNTLNSASPR